MKKAVITILGMAGRNGIKASYSFEGNEAQYHNTLPLLIEKYKDSYEIIPIFTKEAKELNIELLKKSKIEDEFINKIFDEKNLIKDDKDFDNIFKIINDLVEEYDKVIVDVSHGFRHLPILMTIDLIIQNFQNSSKIEKILFAKEMKQGELYEIIDLKGYLDLANIAFILTSFQKNYTVANHIKSNTYEKLIDKLNNFSNDILALNLNNLFKKSSKELVKELDKIDDISIKNQAQILKTHIKKLTDFNGKKRYQTYFDLSKDLFEKNYILLSLALLNESIRLYIKTTIKKSHKEIVEKIEKFYEYNLYDIGDFFIKLKNDKFTFEEFKKYIRNKNRKDLPPITQEEFQKIKDSFPKELLRKSKYKISNYKQNLINSISYARNNLAHGNVNYNFLDIKESVKELLDEYSRYIEDN